MKKSVSLVKFSLSRWMIIITLFSFVKHSNTNNLFANDPAELEPYLRKTTWKFLKMGQNLCNIVTEWLSPQIQAYQPALI